MLKHSPNSPNFKELSLLKNKITRQACKIELIHKLNNNFLSRPKHPSLFKKSRIPKKKKIVKNPITRIDLQKHLDMQKQSNNMENRFIQKAWRKNFFFFFLTKQRFFDIFKKSKPHSKPKKYFKVNQKV